VRTSAVEWKKMKTQDMYLVFNDEAMMHVSGPVNKENVYFEG
jgi:hypothetical protein